MKISDSVNLPHSVKKGTRMAEKKNIQNSSRMTQSFQILER
jgi:hypothetical protein